MEEADRLCSRLAIIDNGQIIVEGRPDELKRSISADTVVFQLDPARGDGVADAGHAGDGIAEVRRLLEGLVATDAVTPHPAGVSLAVPNANAAVPELLRRLESNGLRITGLQITQPNLDDVFMKYTGRRIREEAADQPILLGW